MICQRFNHLNHFRHGQHTRRHQGRKGHNYPIMLKAFFYDFGNALLVCATELRTEDEIAAYRGALQEALDVKTLQKEIA